MSEMKRMLPTPGLDSHLANPSHRPLDLGSLVQNQAETRVTSSTRGPQFDKKCRRRRSEGVAHMDASKFGKTIKIGYLRVQRPMRANS